jgi:hypothetical protein
MRIGGVRVSAGAEPLVLISGLNVDRLLAEIQVIAGVVRPSGDTKV